MEVRAVSETGKNIVNGFRELRKFCREVALLLKAANGFMQENDWTPFRKTTVVGNSSGSLDYPDEWLPTDFSRFYEHRIFRHLLPYVAVLVEQLDEPSRIEQALLSVGWIDYGAGNAVGDWEYHFCNWHLFMRDRADNGKLCSEDPRQTWPDEPPPAGVVKATTFAFPLDETTAETLRENIQRLCAEMAKEATTRPPRDSRGR
jgi:hypothetical protein